jgi:hypothetical protein
MKDISQPIDTHILYQNKVTSVLLVRATYLDLLTLKPTGEFIIESYSNSDVI